MCSLQAWLCTVIPVFLRSSFQLSALFLRFVQFRSVPGGRVSESDKFCFYGCQLVEAVGQSVVVEVNEVRLSWVFREFGGS